MHVSTASDQVTLWGIAPVGNSCCRKCQKPLSSPRFNKWRQPTRNIQPVVIREDSPIATKWPLARTVEVYPGKDKLVRVALVKTANGVYTRPVNKLAVVLPSDDQSLVEHFPPISVV